MSSVNDVNKFGISQRHSNSSSYLHQLNVNLNENENGNLNVNLNEKLNRNLNQNLNESVNVNEIESDGKH